MPSQSKCIELYWLFRSQGKRWSVLYLPGVLSILLCFFSLFFSLSGFSHWISEYPGPLHHGQSGPGPGSGPVDLQHGGRGHWEGGCSAPTHTAAFSTLPCECLPSLPKPPKCPWLTVMILDFSWAIMKPSYLALACLYAPSSHGVFSRQGRVYPYFSQPSSQAFKMLCCSPHYPLTLCSVGALD